MKPDIEKAAKALFDYDQSRFSRAVNNEILYGTPDPVSWERITGPGVTPIIADEYRKKAELAVNAALGHAPVNGN